MRKKGLELSINVLIVIILSLALLVMGVSFFNKLLKGATEYKEKYDQKTAEELEMLLTQGEKVAIPFPRQDIRKGNTIVFGLGIYNSLGYNSKFKVDVRCSKAFEGTEEIDDACDLFSEGGIIYNTNELTIKNNERYKMPIAIDFTKDAEVATYIFNVCVCYGEDSGVCDDTCKDTFPTNIYDSVHKIYVTVK